MNQQFNYALFRNFSHHIALGKVSPLLYLYISKNAQTLKGSLPNPILQVFLQLVHLLQNGTTLLVFLFTVLWKQKKWDWGNLTSKLVLVF